MAVARVNRYCTHIPPHTIGLNLWYLVDKRLLEILCCPVTKSPLRLLAENELATLNRAIATSQVLNGVGTRVDSALTAGLITRDEKSIYRVDDGIPVMLADEAIAVAQVVEFPRTP